MNESGTQLEEIVNAVKKVSDLIGEIAAASQQQSAGIFQVNQAVTDMDQGTQQNAAMVEEASAASDSMQEQSKGLLELTRQFLIHDGWTSGRTTPQTAGSVPAAHRDRSDGPRRSDSPSAAAMLPGTHDSDDDAWRDF